MSGMTRQMAYWYARGYYDGRTFGNEESQNKSTDGLRLGRSSSHDGRDVDALRHAYRQGYDTGVTDYCEMDIEEAQS